MSFTFQYGNFTHAAGEASVVISALTQFVNGIPRSTTYRWALSGRLQAEDIE